MKDKKHSTMGVKSLKPPAITFGDVAYSGTKAALSSIPGMGGPMAELLPLILRSPIEKRRDEWMENIAKGLDDLKNNVLTIEKMQSNEQLVSIIMQATSIALRTHQSEKLKALRNVIFNVATSQAPDDAMQSIFLNIVDTFTDWHIKILKLFQKPSVLGGMTELYQILECAYPELADRSDLYDAIWNDLSTRELVNMRSLHGSLSGLDLLTNKRTTTLGDQLIKFISTPSE